MLENQCDKKFLKMLASTVLAINMVIVRRGIIKHDDVLKIGRIKLDDILKIGDQKDKKISYKLFGKIVEIKKSRFRDLIE